jgi:5'-3' exoribonuclease 1
VNESGVINTKRLQVVLNQMDEWEREIFEREYGDMNWYKGKQRQHTQKAEKSRKGGESKLCRCSIPYLNNVANFLSAMTISQRMIFDQVKAFVSQNQSAKSSETKMALLTMPNMFPAGDKLFIQNLATDLHLTLTWDEYDEQDQNLVTWRFPGALEEPLSAVDDESDDESEDDEEARKAVERVLKKYEKAKVALDSASDDFDVREDQRIKNRMDEWKRGYYWVGLFLCSFPSVLTFSIGQAEDLIRRSRCDGPIRVQVHRGYAMGDALLL